MDEIGEIILPESDQSPGAKATESGHFLAKKVHDCYGTREQETFRQALKTIDLLAHEAQEVDFVSLDFEQKTELLTQLDREAAQSVPGESVHFYSLQKQLTLLGYFTSEIGVTQALRCDPSPGDYKAASRTKKGALPGTVPRPPLADCCYRDLPKGRLGFTKQKLKGLVQTALIIPFRTALFSETFF
jgi:hypothetical protein